MYRLPTKKSILGGEHREENYYAEAGKAQNNCGGLRGIYQVL